MRNCSCGFSLEFADDSITKCYACRNLWSDDPPTVKMQVAKPTGKRKVRVGDTVYRYTSIHSYEAFMVDSLEDDGFHANEYFPCAKNGCFSKDREISDYTPYWCFPGGVEIDV